MGKIKLYKDVMEVGLPFICINEGGFENVAMLIDTGSTNNILFGYVYEQVKGLLQEVESNYTITGIDGKPRKATAVVGNMPFCGKRYEMMFLVQEDNDPGQTLSEEMGVTVIGMIGTQFMAEHGWLIDFAKQEIRIPDDISTNDLSSLRSK